jgi:hypothetical protein
VGECFLGAVQIYQSNTHELIIGKADAYGKSVRPGRTEARQIARDMFLFKKMRKSADYKIIDDFEKTDTNSALVLGSSILKNCHIIRQKQLDI